MVGVAILGLKTELELEFKFEYHISALESVNGYISIDDMVATCVMLSNWVNQ